jgi:hypothetical protein
MRARIDGPFRRLFARRTPPNDKSGHAKRKQHLHARRPALQRSGDDKHAGNECQNIGQDCLEKFQVQFLLVTASAQYPAGALPQVAQRGRSRQFKELIRKPIRLRNADRPKLSDIFAHDGPVARLRQMPQLA